MHLHEERFTGYGTLRKIDIDMLFKTILSGFCLTQQKTSKGYDDLF